MAHQVRYGCLVHTRAHSRNARDYVSASNGSSALDPVWLAAVRAEAGVGAGLAAASVTADIAAFFESMDPENKDEVQNRGWLEPGVFYDNLASLL